MEKSQKKFNYLALIGMIGAIVGPIVYYSFVHFNICDIGFEFICTIAFYIITTIAALVLCIIGLVRRKKYTGAGFIFSLIGIIIASILSILIVIDISKQPYYYWTGNILSNNSGSSYDYDYDDDDYDDDDYDDYDYDYDNYKTPVQTKEEYISECQAYTYEQIARRPDDFIDKKATFTGEVIQVQEVDDSSIVMRVNITKKTYQYIDSVTWSDTIYVTYTYGSGESKILEDDVITMYGELKGSTSYTSTLGSKITLPKFNAKYVTINQ